MNILKIVTEMFKPTIAKLEDLDKRIKKLEEERDYFTKVENIKDVNRTIINGD